MLQSLYCFIFYLVNREEEREVIDISSILAKEMKEKNCNALFALMTYGVHIPKPESGEESSGRLCDKRNINSDEQIMGIHLHGDSGTRV